MSKYTINFILLVLLSFTGLQAQKPCYDSLRIKGKNYLGKKEYKEAFEHFIAARNCWDLPPYDTLDIYIDSTSNLWTSALKTAERRAIGSRDTAIIQKKRAEREWTINESYRKGYESQNALKKNETTEALQLAFDARYIIDVYNAHDSSEIDTVIIMPDFVIEAFGDAVFAEHHKKQKTGHNKILGFGVADSGDRFYTFGRESGLKIWSIDGDSLGCIDVAMNKDIYKSKFIISANFSRNGRQLLACMKGQASKVWQEDNNQLITLNHDTTLVQGVFFNRGQQVLTIDRKGAAQLWGIKGGKIKEANLYNGPLLEIKLDTIANIAFIRSAYHVFKLELDSFKKTQLTESDAYLFGMEISPRKKQILTVSASQKAQIVDYKSKHNKTIGFESAIYTSSFNQKYNQFMIGTQNGLVNIMDINGREIGEAFNLSKPIRKVIFSFDGNNGLAFSRDSNVICLYGSNVKEIKTTGAIVTAIFDTQNEKILSSSNDGLVNLWSINGKSLMNMPIANTPYEATFVDSDRKIITVTTDGTFYITPVPELVFQDINDKEKNN